MKVGAIQPEAMRLVAKRWMTAADPPCSLHWGYSRQNADHAAGLHMIIGKADAIAPEWVSARHASGMKSLRAF
jgi:hypothetical protein